MMNRRKFLTGTASAAAAFADTGSGSSSGSGEVVQDTRSAIDFRFAPPSWQATYCFPDDPFKSMIGDRGELRYGLPNRAATVPQPPPVTVEFSAQGVDPDNVMLQRLEAPGIPIFHTRIERPEAILELTTFATNTPGEGRVDNTIFEIRPRIKRMVHAFPLVRLRTKREVFPGKPGELAVVRLDGETKPIFFAADTVLLKKNESALGTTILMKDGTATAERPLRSFFRFPQEGQGLERIQDGLANPARVLEEARNYWQSWLPFEGRTSWSIPGRYGEFLVACARNIQQARERREGKLVFQVGPTVYRGLFVVDGNFLLEAARYLGYENGVREGLETTWARQDSAGGVFALAGKEHWKDTGIAIFTLVRQCELSQDWRLFDQMRPAVLRAVGFLENLRNKAHLENSANGRYGLLPRGYGDGGLGGVRSEFTNTVWVLAGLKALVEAAARRRMPGFEKADTLYRELRTAFFSAAAQEMRRHPAGFDYLPMLMKEDPDWNAPDMERLPPQCGQWALSHAIYPGRVFEKDHAIVKGHIALMQACTQEDIPAETGWIHREGAWNYNAAFVAHAYLWAGVTDWARLTFHGFLNHACPLYCWWEEQPFRGSMQSGFVGDMPHNWASAECILYLRHMLALEDGQDLRLLNGVHDFELAAREPYLLAASPTRFGTLDLALEPLDRKRGWRLNIQRGHGPDPASASLPLFLGSRYKLSAVAGAQWRQQGASVLIDPSAKTWTATWEG